MNKIIGEYASLCTFSAWGVKLIADFVFFMVFSHVIEVWIHPVFCC